MLSAILRSHIEPLELTALVIQLPESDTACDIPIRQCNIQTSFRKSVLNGRILHLPVIVLYIKIELERRIDRHEHLRVLGKELFHIIDTVIRLNERDHMMKIIRKAPGENPMIRLAEEKDLPYVSEIYEELHTAEENGLATIGWIRGIYPTEKTAETAFSNGELFVEEDGGKIVGAAIINRKQVDVYSDGDWIHDAPDDEVMVACDLPFRCRTWLRKEIRGIL